MRLLERLSIGVDIGGTKLAAGVVDLDGSIVDRARRDTPSTSSAVEATVADVVGELRGRHDVGAVGIGAAGFVDITGSTVLFAPHLAWRHEPLRDAVRRRVGLPVVVENDANAAAWAEFRFGAAQREPDLVCLTLGTGIGGAIMIGGRLHRGRHGLAGEFGHIQVVPGGHPCPCGNRGCWEQYASGNALVREARRLATAEGPDRSPVLQAVAGTTPEISGPIVSEAARAGDAVAQGLLAEVGGWLGVGMAGLAAALDAGLFVVGGGLSEADGLLLDPARDSFSATLTGRGFRPEARIVRAHLGNDAGIVGAADLARSRSSRFRVRLRPRERRGAYPGARTG